LEIPFSITQELNTKKKGDKF